jgi:DNA-binding response OmpR family regulator
MSESQDIKVLLVEDEGLVALMIEDILEDLGYEVVASVPSLDRARAVASVAEIDFAILDVNLAGEQSFPAARILRERGVPFLFSTGYGTAGIPSEFQECPVLSKPFSASALAHAISLVLKDDGRGPRLKQIV